MQAVSNTRKMSGTRDWTRSTAAKAQTRNRRAEQAAKRAIRSAS